VQGARHLDFMLREGYSKRHKVAKLCREMLTPFAAKLAIHGRLNLLVYCFTGLRIRNDPKQCT
jgi:hypothetical protein